LSKLLNCARRDIISNNFVVDIVIVVVVVVVVEVNFLWRKDVLITLPILSRTLVHTPTKII